MADQNKQKIVQVPNIGVVAFPGDMEDEHVAAAIRAFRSQKAADQAAQSHPLNRPQPLMTEQSERQRQTKQAQPLSTALPHLPAWLNTPSTELGKQAGDWLSGEIGKVLGTKLPDIELGAVGEQEAAQFRQNHPIAGGVAQGISDIANSLTTPASTALLLTAPESKLMSGLFSLQALHGAYKDAQAAREAYRQGNNEEATRYATESILGGAMGLAAGAHATRPVRGPQGEILPPEAKPQPEFPALPPSTPMTLEGKTGGFALPEYNEAPIANYQLIYRSPAADPEELNNAVNDLVKARESKGWSDPNATPEEVRAAQRDFYNAADRLGRMKQQSVGQIRQIPSGEKVVYLTDAGLQDLHAGLRGRAPDPEYSLNGVSIHGRYIPIVQANLAALNTPHSKELTKLLSMGAGPDGTVTVSAIPNKNETLSNALSRLREELNHGWQKQFSDAMGNHLLPSEFKSLNQAIPDAMSGYLRQNGYPEDSGDKEANRMRVLEASAKAMSGAPSEFGMTPDEAANYLFQYFDAVTKAHGPKALDELVHTTTLARNIKKDYANARNPSRRSQSQGTLPSLPAGGQRRTQTDFGAPGRGTAPVAGPPAAAPATAPSVDFSRGAIAKTPEEIAASTDWTNPPRAASTVDGLEVTSHIPNQSSIDSALDSPTVLPGIREIPLDKEWYAAPEKTFAAADDVRRARDLAEKIRQSGKIDPLIVSVEDGKPYILEGVHRLSALHILGKKAFPAMVVLEGGPEMNQTRRTPESSPSTLSDLMEEAKRRAPGAVTTETPEFKRWFGDSKVVGPDDKPLVVYHGTQAGQDFSEFSTEGRQSDEMGEYSTSGSGADPTAYMGAHFAQEPHVANKFATGSGASWLKSRYEAKGEAGPRVMPAFLSIKKPMDFGAESNMRDFIYRGKLEGYAGEELLNRAMEADGVDPEDDESAQGWMEKYDSDPDFRAEQNEWVFESMHHQEGEDELADEAAADLARQAKERLRSQGYDGIRYKNEVEGGTSWIAFDPEQVKSAIGNRGTFNPSSADITMNQTRKAEPSAPANTPEFRRWFGSSTVTNADGTPKVLYHSTNSDWNVLDPDMAMSGSFGFHAGTKEQAEKVRETGGTPQDVNKQRPLRGMNVMPVYLKIEHPLRMEDHGTWYPFDMVDYLAKNHGIEDPSEPPDTKEAMRIMDWPSHMTLTYENATKARKNFDIKVREKMIDWRKAHPDASRDQYWNEKAKVERRYVIGLIEKAGYDGIVYDNKHEGGGDSYMVFHPDQIKSALGNRGTYDPTNPDITMNQVRATKETAKPKVQDLMAEALRRRPTQPTLEGALKDVAARGPAVVP